MTRIGSMLARFMVTAVTALVGLFGAPAVAGVVFEQPPDPAGGQYKSAWYPPDGLDGDQYVYDAFIVPTDQAITEIHWRGAYTNYLSGAGKSPVSAFTIKIYASIGGGSQPDVTKPALVKYSVTGNAGETPAGTFGGVTMYDYSYSLASPFQAVGGTKYWVQIEASQGLTPQYYWPPDWSIARGTGGDNSHFEKITGGNYRFMTGDAAFSLYAAAGASWTISATVSPANTGTIMGAGTYPAGATVSLQATANAGFGFAKWTENGSQVSTNAHYTFTATRDRVLVANFVNSCTITTSHWPVYGGTTAGDGVFNEGSTVQVSATPRQGFEFGSWTIYGNVVSTSATYSFTASMSAPLVANFVPLPRTVTFDLDSGSPPPTTGYTSTPFEVTFDGVTAWFSSPQDFTAFSLQTDGTTFMHHLQLTGNYLWPDSIYRNDLVIRFSFPVTSVSLDFNTVEMESWADTPSPLVLKAYRGSLSNPLIGSAQSAGVYAATTYPEGVLVFSSATPFDIITLAVGPNSWGTVNFMSDNFTVTYVCGADFDGSGFVDTDDYDAFVHAFEAGENTADFDASGFVDTDDFDAYVHAFEAGC